MDEPIYPGVQGQPVPNLGLAQYSGISTPETAIGPAYGGHFADSTPSAYINQGPVTLDPFDHDPMIDIANMGIDPNVPYYHLQLANDFDVQTPTQLAAPTENGEVNMPTFTAPDMCGAMLKAGDIAGAGLNQVNEMEPDPCLPDLEEYSMPDGIDIHAMQQGQNVEPDPALPDLDKYDQPAGLDMLALIQPDPLLPDLQQPVLTPEIMMSDRPGDLATDALGEMAQSATYKQLPTDQYNELYMDQSGMNTHRERHEGMRDLGLEKEERGDKSRKPRSTRDADEHDYED